MSQTKGRTDAEVIADLREWATCDRGHPICHLRYNVGPYVDATDLPELVELIAKRLDQHVVGTMIGDESMKINKLEAMTIRLICDSAGLNNG